jgi:hypothetical protein
MVFNFANAQTEREGNGNGGESDVGEVHCALGGFGLILVMATLAAGFLVSGRFGRLTGFKPLPIHKLVVIIMAIYLTGEFIYGITVRNIFFLNSVHGNLAFLTIMLAWITVGLNPLLMTKHIKWKRASKLHLIFAASIFTILIVHLAYAFTLFGE